MMSYMKRALLALIIASALLSGNPALASQEEDVKQIDARYIGYDRDVYVKGDSTGLSWLLLIVLATFAVAVLFKSGSRTHLD